jgi:hypothetical protein
MNTLHLKTKQKQIDAALDLAQRVGMRFIERNKRYILQMQLVEIDSEPQQLTWVDVPLCPEIYGPAVKL